MALKIPLGHETDGRTRLNFSRFLEHQLGVTQVEAWSQFDPSSNIFLDFYLPTYKEILIIQIALHDISHFTPRSQQLRARARFKFRLPFIQPHSLDW